MRKVLIANRGEIAVRIARACRDAGLGSVAVYADCDRDAPHVALADEAYSLTGDGSAGAMPGRDGSRPETGSSPAATYLRIDKLLSVAARSGADAVHPGYGFLAENADFAEAVIAAGLTWIGPSPQAIRDLGDKVTARHIAQRAGAPLVAGTPDPVGGPGEVVEFAREHGLPVAIKAAFGGGGRGLKVAHTIDEIPALFESATREAVAAFGRGECFVERYLDQPRHVEAQVLADRFGSVIVVGTRDCSLQRRHQKLVEEAPAPFLTHEQRRQIHSSAKAICREAGYHGAGTVEYLVGRDGTVSFLEVNTRLQVEHPVTEETSGIDLVREQFHIAAGKPLRFTDDPEPRGHSIEFRINGEDPGRNFLPAPGTITALRLPGGPGVRVDAGVVAGGVLGSDFDSLLAKLIITGATRAEAIERARRALDEMVVDGVPTVLPFHRLVVRDEAFTAEPFSVHTRWIETEWHNTVPPYPGVPEAAVPPERETIVVEVDGKRLEVSLPAGYGAGTASAGTAMPVPPATPRRSGAGRRHATVVDGEALTSPMQGTIVKIAVADGDLVAEGDLVVVLEAMKMEQPINAHKAGVVRCLTAAVGDVVPAGSTIAMID